MTRKAPTGCPQDFEHQRLLGAAELARVTDRGAEALGLYEQVIAAAQQVGFVQVAAIASELCARLHRGPGRGPLARARGWSSARRPATRASPAV